MIEDKLKELNMLHVELSNAYAKQKIVEEKISKVREEIDEMIPFKQFERVLCNGTEVYYRGVYTADETILAIISEEPFGEYTLVELDRLQKLP